MTNFNISTNIIRDDNSSLNYIVTKNAIDNFNLIVSNFHQNNKFQGIIGSYGTGKSSFLWALEQNLTRKSNYFESIEKAFPDIESFDFIKIIGEYTSLSAALAKTLKLRTSGKSESVIEEKVISKLGQIIKSNTKQKTGTILVIDEFGKFLEYAVKNNPDKEVYFIQQLAEFFNDSKKIALAISSLHQNFSSYGQGLTKEQFKEWEKVKGRMKEIPFNEPIDQLLYFASEKNLFDKVELNGKATELFSLIKSHNISDKKNSISDSLANKLLPLDYISAEVLAKALQRYGQNERSLFSFLEIDESFSFKRFYKDSLSNNSFNRFYNLSYVYDYILEHYFYVISSVTNSDLTHWNSIKAALDQVDTRLDDEYILDARKIVKTIGLLNIFSHLGSTIDDSFIKSYSKLALNIENVEIVLEKLIKQKIIAYKNYKHRFVFVDWTDIDIDFELQQAGSKIQTVGNVAERVSQLQGFHPILVKAYYFKTGTPRIFEYKFSNKCLSELPSKSDAIINYIFPQEDFKVEKTDAPIIDVVFENTNEIKSIFFEIDKAKKVKEENREDRAAIKELDERIFINEQKLKNILFDDVYTNPEVTWYFNGRKFKITNKAGFNKKLNSVLDKYYSNSPIFKSELVNKSKLSTPISTARKNLISQLIENRDKKDIGFEENKYPPEKTIYLSLIKATGIHQYDEENDIYKLTQPDFKKNKQSATFETLWETSIEFLEESKKGKKNVKDLYTSLLAPPLKLKQGFIDFWVPIFLIITSEDYALFNKNGYIPNITPEVFDVMYKSPQKFWIKAFDISGVKLEVFNKYKAILNKKRSEKPSEKDFINTIKPFIIFTRSLNYYSSNTKKLTPQSIDLREAIKKAKDPEKAFFEDFPKALNYDEALAKGDEAMLEGFVGKMEDSINEIRKSYEELLTRFETKIVEVLDAPGSSLSDYKNLFDLRLGSINPSLLNSKLRNLLRKCINPVTDRKLFLEGIAYALLGKGLENIDDEEEDILHRNFEENYKHLLELVDIHKLRKTHKNEAIYGIKIFNEEGSDIEEKIIIPSESGDLVKKEIEKINKGFKGIDKSLKKAILIQLLKDEIYE